MKTLLKSFLFVVISLSVGGCNVGMKLKNRRVYQSVSPFLFYYQGVTSRIFGDYSSAIKNLNIAKLKEPNKDAIYYELALSYAALQNVDSAILNLEKAVSIDNQNLAYRLLLRSLYVEKKYFNKALLNQAQIIQIDSTNNFNQFHLALLYAEIDSLEKALDILEKLEDNEGFNPNISETKLKIYLGKSNIQASKNELSKLINFSPQNPYYLLYQSDLYFMEGYDNLGLQVLDSIVTQNPDFLYAKYELFTKQFNFGNKDKALTLLYSIFDDPSQSEEEKAKLFYPLLFDKSLYNTRKQKLDSIIDAGLIHHPKSILINQVAYEHYLRLNSFEMAKNVLQTIVQIDPTNSEKFEQLINFQYSLGYKDDVLKTSDSAILLFPQKSIFYIYKSIVYEENKQIHKSIESLNKGIQTIKDKSELSEIYGTLGDIYYKQGNSKETYKQYKKSLINNPNNARILNNYAYYLAMDNMNLTKALEMSTKAVTLEPNNSTYIDTRGWILFTMQRFEEARDVLRNAVAKDGSTNPILNEHYGDALYKTGNKEGAYIYWLKAKDLGGGTEFLEIKINTKSYAP